jgi:hypothetical protein
VTPCVQKCQESHAVCIQSSNVGSGGYGNADAALIGGLISMAMASSARSRCAEVLKDCYGTCGQTITQTQANLADVCANIRCPDGGPGLWIGKATVLALEVSIAVYMCKTDSQHVSGQWACAQVQPAVECVTQGGPIDGVVDGNTLRLVSQPRGGGRVSRCDFTAWQTAPLTLEGTYSCTGNVSTAGKLMVARCPQ